VLAGEELRKMGRMSFKEVRLVIIMLLVMAGWITSSWHHVPNPIVALLGVCAILVTEIISWQDLLAEGRAWEALIWFGALIMMADNLRQAGIVTLLANGVFHYVHGWSWIAALIVLVILYLYIHYGFASMTAQVTALYSSFLAAALACGANPMIAALSFAYFSNLNAAMTHYGTGSAPVYFGNGYVSMGAWWRIGFVISLFNLAIWLGVGMLWWKLLGWW
jgi:DASS family divalent anion:Na+ symporter